jgi:hypothetical protein
MEKTGASLVRHGYGIVTGNASGADQAWARGGNSVDPTKVTLCLPWQGFESRAICAGNVVQFVEWDTAKHCLGVAAKMHPKTERMSSAVMWLYARNVMIIEAASAAMGSLNSSKTGGGGTGFAFRVARLQGLPVVNVANESTRVNVDMFLHAADDLLKALAA